MDDALAILLALGSPELHVEGLSIARGNGKEGSGRAGAAGGCGTRAYVWYTIILYNNA